MRDILDYADLLRWGGWGVAAVLLLPRLWVALRAIGKVPVEVRNDLDELARRRIQERQRDAALARLAEKADEILAQLRPNGGSSVVDKLERLVENVEAHIRDSASDSALLLTHVKETAPLIAQYQQDLAERGSVSEHGA